MEKNESIIHVLKSMDSNIVYKAKTSILWSLLLVILGIAFFIVYTSFEWGKSDVLPHFLFILGSVFIIVGLFMFFFRKEHYFSTNTRQKLKRTEVYFQVNELDKLVRLIEVGSLKEMKDLKTSISDGLKLIVMTTQDGQVCLSQVIAYVGSEYVNVTAVQHHSSDDARLFAEYFHWRKLR